MIKTTCGHAPTPIYYSESTTATVQRADGTHERINVGGEPMTSGTATSPDGSVLCYPCADEVQRNTVEINTIFSAYLSGDGRKVTTWTGGELAKVTSLGTSDVAGFYDSTMHYVTARTPDGRTWYGRNGGTGRAITMRAHKGGTGR